MSSKINEFDIDPNVGFAKEETSQKIYNLLGGDEASEGGSSGGGVAKAEDVQEILDRIKKNMTGKAVKIAGSSNSVATNFTSLSPVLEVTGSGELVWLGVFNRASGAGSVRQVRIEMDDAVIFDGTINGTTSTTYDLYFNTGCLSVLMPVVGNNTLFPTATGGTVSISSYGNVEVTLRPQLYNWTDKTIYCYIPFTEPIRFERSLKVYFKNYPANHLTYSIGYTLD